MKNRTILQGDVLEKLQEIPDGVIDCIISSPPYWGLRDYGVDGQLGLEPDFRDYLKIMSQIMDELKRVLKNTGSCWINLGDTYASSGGPSRHFGYNDPKYGNNKGGNFIEPAAFDQGIIPKSRFGIPERFYINCIDSGWIARNHIPWYKANSMPSSVKDRFTNKWESIFFFVKNQKYYFNLDAVRVKTTTESKSKQKENPTHTQSPLFGEIETNPTEENSSHRYTNEELGHRNGLGKSTLDRINNKAQDQYTKRVLEARKNGSPHDNPLGSKTTFTIKDISKLTTIPLNELTPTIICQLIGHNPEDICNHCGRSYKRHASTVRGTTSHTNYPVFALCNGKGKNPGDVIFDNQKPYSVVERSGTVYYRNLPEHDEIRKYLNTARKDKGITVDELENIFKNYTPHHWFERNGSYPTREDWIKVKGILEFDSTYDEQMTTLFTKPAEKQNDPKGKNPGDIFMINPKPFAEAHFATFPVDLPLKILKCACPKQVCSKCGIPRYPIIQSKSYPREKSRMDDRRAIGQKYQEFLENNPPIITEYSKCNCNEPFEPGVVLDCFFGAGTVGVAAEQLGLQWCGIELSTQYIKIAKKRLEKYRNDKLNGVCCKLISNFHVKKKEMRGLK